MVEAERSISANRNETILSLPFTVEDMGKTSGEQVVMVLRPDAGGSLAKAARSQKGSRGLIKLQKIRELRY